jgi:outer membrane protein TolC
MERYLARMLAVLLLLWACRGPRSNLALAQDPTNPAQEQPRPSDRERPEPPLPPALPDLSEEPLEVAPEPAREPGVTIPAAEPEAYDVDANPLRLSDAIRRSLANVQTVQANVAVRTAQVARFDALREFIPLVTMPQLFTGFNRLAGKPGTNVIFPDVTGGTPLVGSPGIDHAELSRVFLSFPLDPSGQITALPVAEEGIRAKVLMEQLVRRSQAALAIQRYFEAKQIPYGIRVARRTVTLTTETRALVGRKLREKQAHDVELSEAEVEESRARVFLADLEKNSRIAQRELGVVLHQSRLLVPQSPQPIPILPDPGYAFDLDDPDLVDLAVVPDFPQTREAAIELARRQRVEVRILIVGLRIARLRQKHDWLGLLGKGLIPAELSFKNTTPQNGGTALGAIFGTIYTPPIVDIDLWSSIRQARLDVIQSQLDLEKTLIDVANDTGNSWDRWQQAAKEWQQREKELALRQELFERQQRLYLHHQSFPVEVLGTEVNLLQADANRWTAWYNLQLARLDMLRSTELLLDYIEKAGIARIPVGHEEPESGFWKHRLAWLRRKKSDPSLPAQEGLNQGGQDHDSPMVAGVGRNDGAAGGRRLGGGTASPTPGATTDSGLIRTSGNSGGRDPSFGRNSDRADPPGVPVRRAQPGRPALERPAGDPAGRSVPRRADQSAVVPAATRGGDSSQGNTARSTRPAGPADLANDSNRGKT